MTDALIQKEFAGYRIESRVGRGGMGVVYRATELALDRSVALKVLTEDLAQDAGFRRRFVSESKLAASLDHPNVIPIHAAGEHEGILYIAMRFVPGDDLRDGAQRAGAGSSPSAPRGSSRRSRPRWTPRTPTASSIATSSRPTCWSPPRTTCT